ncbi:MAG: VCBS repeat-containing protein [Kofleriaceae bacterium]|nr:VCBS repeat-containing protein [Kofleriaceae bacterium]MBP6840833.1 VCBS repeat-containing protein [Kofleriaceae bacterium]MBP9207968.1 VCBS repeat-containing protein [Kofleriaceae bacterium]
MSVRGTGRSSVGPALLVALLVAVGAVAATPAGAGADAGAGEASTPLARLLARARAELAAMVPALVRPRVAPSPISVTYRARRAASIELGAPLLGLIGADLDGDGRAELFAVTSREVVVLAGGARVTEQARLALPAALPAIEPRDPIAAVELEPGPRPALLVRTSTRARGLRIVAATGAAGPRWVGAGELERYPGCGEPLVPAPGRNHFGAADAPIFARRCRADLVAADGAPLAVSATLGPGGVLRVASACADCPASVAPSSPVEVRGVGTAFDLADLDRDGELEVIVAGDGPPGARDEIRVLSVADPGGKARFRRTFTGGVAGVAAVDLDGDGRTEVVCAVRLVGTSKVDLWRLN